MFHVVHCVIMVLLLLHAIPVSNVDRM